MNGELDERDMTVKKARDNKVALIYIVVDEKKSYEFPRFECNVYGKPEIGEDILLSGPHSPSADSIEDCRKLISQEANAYRKRGFLVKTQINTKSIVSKSV